MVVYSVRFLLECPFLEKGAYSICPECGRNNGLSDPMNNLHERNGLHGI